MDDRTATALAAAENDRTLARVLPDAADRVGWSLATTSTAVDTGARVFHYVYRHTGRMLRLDERGRVYGQDAQGAVRLFGRGGPLALHVVLNMVFDGCEDRRPSRIVLPR